MSLQGNKLTGCNCLSCRTEQCRNSEIEQLKEEIKRLSGCKYIIAQQKDKNRLLATENAQLDAKNIAVRKENEELKKEISEFEIQVKKLKSNWHNEEIARMETVREKLRKDVTEKNKRRDLDKFIEKLKADRVEFEQLNLRTCLEQQIRNLEARIKVDSVSTLEEIYHAGWAVIVHRISVVPGAISKTELETLRRLRSALEPIQAKVHICNPYDTVLD